VLFYIASLCFTQRNKYLKPGKILLTALAIEVASPLNMLKLSPKISKHIFKILCKKNYHSGLLSVPPCPIAPKCILWDPSSIIYVYNFPNESLPPSGLVDS
jgi:hypothetical protein